jgi:hypothetical protein
MIHTIVHQNTIASPMMFDPMFINAHGMFHSEHCIGGSRTDSSTNMMIIASTHDPNAKQSSSPAVRAILGGSTILDPSHLFLDPTYHKYGHGK